MIRHKFKSFIGGLTAITSYKVYDARPVPSTAMYADTKDQLMNIEPNSPFVHCARTMVLAPFYLVSRMIATTTNNVTIKNSHQLNKLVSNQRVTEDGKPLGLITVSNHTSSLDDPVIFSVMLPISSKMRWTICAEEYCAKNKFMTSMFGCGKILPICRGNGRYQPMMWNLLERLELGDWVHIFPEGRIWQETGSPSRDEEKRRFTPSGRVGEPGKKLGPLKWGVGRLIADCEVTPVVIPIFHIGMDKMMPQNKKNKLISWKLNLGQNINVIVGDPIEFDDMIADFENHLSAAKEEAESNGIYGSNVWNKWVIAEENKLQSKITERINVSMLELEAQVMALEQYQASKQQNSNSNSNNPLHRKLFVQREKYYDNAKERISTSMVKTKNKVKIIREKVVYSKNKVAGRVTKATATVKKTARRIREKAHAARRVVDVVRTVSANSRSKVAFADEDIIANSDYYDKKDMLD